MFQQPEKVSREFMLNILAHKHLRVRNAIGSILGTAGQEASWVATVVVIVEAVLSSFWVGVYKHVAAKLSIRLIVIYALLLIWFFTH